MTLALAAGGVILVGKTLLPLTGNPAASILGALVAFSGAVWLGGRWLDRRRFQAFGLRLQTHWWSDLGFGLALGLSLPAVIFLVAESAGWVSATQTLSEPDPLEGAMELLPPLLVFIAVGFYEELLVRGYLLGNMAEGLNIRRLRPQHAVIGAWVLTSLLFAVGHVNNPNASFVGTCALVFAGLFVGLARILTADLWIPIGTHIGWNFALNSIFGFSVSGVEPSVSVLAIEERGPDIVTGGPFGPEAGLLGLFAYVVGALATVLWIRWKHGRLKICGAIAKWDGAPEVSESQARE